MARLFKNVVVLTGAGISAESGIATFRGASGLWENHRFEDVATPEAFARDPELVHRFYNMRRRLHEGAPESGDALAVKQSAPLEPNEAHRALSEFEERTRANFLLITQNVDALHERAGSQNVLHMHGELLKMRCDRTGEVYSWTRDCSPQAVCDCCGLPGRLRPHIVWFGEVPFFLDVIERALLQCDLFVSIGTSGHVYPAAGFCRIARSSGAHTVELNLEPSENVDWFDEGRYGSAGSIVPQYFRELS